METLNILVVDDSATSRMLFKAHFPKDRVAQIREARDKASALAAIESVEPDLVVLDYNMPDATGTEVAVALRGLGCQATMVLLTANTQQSVVLEAKETGIGLVVEKPISAEKLANMLSALQL